ncbi:hypothetical protein DH2020_003853 [Rehmannia glutinosa]|uniref:Uncharacterized protein n=1 Tax=Rehmannia glutinosa TaxID=99300 RepID=A0ABR0XMR1_REHGL
MVRDGYKGLHTVDGSDIVVWPRRGAVALLYTFAISYRCITGFRFTSAFSDINFAKVLSISKPYPHSDAIHRPFSSAIIAFAFSPAALLLPSPPPSDISPSPYVAFPPSVDGVSPAPHQNSIGLNKAGLAATAFGFFVVALVA